jgi:RNase_H superfamily
MSLATLDRRLANLRALRASPDPAAGPPEGSRPATNPRSIDLAGRMAAVLDAEVVVTAAGTVVRCEQPSRPLPIDRDRLAGLPGQPGADVPLLCLDIETTGLATAAGTLAFLVGLGWWEMDRFRQVQLLMPDQADEPALLNELSDRIPLNGWLVTYNGRSFDWPLLASRYRLARRVPPAHAGHLDLLPLVRRVFRHRMENARLKTVESALLGMHRHGDVEGWEIPGRYLDFLRFGTAEPLVDVVRHNDEDVRSLARLLAHLESGYGDAAARAVAPAGDLAGLGRSFAMDGRLVDALECLDAALASDRPPVGRTQMMAEPAIPTASARPSAEDNRWWSPRHRPDFGGWPRVRAAESAWRAAAPSAVDVPWTDERMLLERARLLRRLGRHRDAEATWRQVAGAGGRLGILAWIEVAKVREHRLRDLPAALAATVAAGQLVVGQRRLGRPLPWHERELEHRRDRLERRLRRAARVNSSIQTAPAGA